MEKISFFDAIDQNKRNSIILIAVIILVFLALVWVISEVFDYGECGYLLGFVFLIFYVLTAYYAGDKAILALSGAKEIQYEDNPYLHNVVEGLAMAANVPKPRIYLINNPFPNAFATGRDPGHSAIAVTTGLLETMKKEELAGVLAHEMSHIANYDIRFMMLTVALVGAIGLLSELFLRTFLYGGYSGNRRKGGGILVLLGLVFMILAPLMAYFVRMAISREREYLADAGAAQLTRYPEGLARALEKIKDYPHKMERVSNITAPLYIADPFKSAAGLFATHPPIDERVARLRKM